MMSVYCLWGPLEPGWFSKFTKSLMGTQQNPGSNKRQTDAIKMLQSQQLMVLHIEQVHFAFYDRSRTHKLKFELFCILFISNFPKNGFDEINHMYQLPIICISCQSCVSLSVANHMFQLPIICIGCQSYVSVFNHMYRQ